MRKKEASQGNHSKLFGCAAKEKTRGAVLKTHSAQADDSFNKVDE